MGFFAGGVEAAERGRFVSGEEIEVERAREALNDAGNLAGRVIREGLQIRGANRVDKHMGNDRHYCSARVEKLKMTMIGLSII